ncbi:prepilin-type N-terminal cleavage/methylation domain-containing protein [Candidatus Saccharibacteria bacterium]|nr:prepilin-type N-terminal cleavage/methylation domain-containing protein [Candidatus Saccharibacteria bacterium]
MKWVKQTHGFTIVELLIVIVVIGILAAITIVAFNGVQARALNARVQSDIKNAHRIVEAYNVINGSYPSTGGMSVVRSDTNCIGGTKQAAWIPNVTETLPQSQPNSGINGVQGCYLYSSDGQYFIISAWNGVNGGPQNSMMYRRLGFREMFFINASSYICNHTNIGGGSTYNQDADYYKRSYTISNITYCNETPPVGA